jgi:hypothetical protein
MSQHIEQTIAELQDEIRKQEEETVMNKRMVNRLCARANRPSMYPDAELSVQGPIGVYRSDQFYGRPLAVCVREYLEMRKSSNQGAASVNDILSALRQGGYDLKSISKDEDAQKRGVAISLAKNTAVFHRLDNGDFGLLSWYPTARERRRETPDESEKEQTTEPKAETNGEETPPKKRAGKPAKGELFSTAS